MALVPRILEELQKRNIGNLPIFVGGIIPADDIPALKALGVAEVFGPGTNTQTLVGFIHQVVGI